MGGRKSEAYPCEKKGGGGGAEKVLAMLKGRGGREAHKVLG